MSVIGFKIGSITEQYNYPALDNIPDGLGIQGYVEDWLDEHPEATTTVQDGSITPVKLDTKLYKAYLRTESVMHLFPSLATGGYSGNSSLMVVKGKCVLFDCGISSNWDAIKAYYDQLYTDGIFTNIDYIIISHYHGDHIQCLGDILERYPHDGCMAYLPLDPTGYAGGTSGVLSNRTQVLDTLTEYNVQYTEISTDTDIEILDGVCTINLFNSTPTDYAYYSANADAVYNDYSMCALVKIGEVYALYPGDIQRQAQIRICNTRTLHKLILYVTHHHAIQNDDYIPYLDMIEPEYAVIQTNHTRNLESAASSFAANYACKNVYSCGYDACAVVIGKDSGSVIDGISLPKTGWYYSYVDYYVDNSYVGAVHNGTSEHPFTNINEALMFVKENSNMHYRIHVIATAETYPFTWCRDFTIPINIIGVSNGNYEKPVVDGFYVRNLSDITLTNIVFSGAGRTTNNVLGLLYASNSSVTVSDCEFNTSGQNYNLGIQSSLSTFYIVGCIFNDLTIGIISYRFAKTISNNNVFKNVRRVYDVHNMELYIRGLDTLTNCTYYIYAADAGIKDVTVKEIKTAEELTAFSALVALNTNTAISNVFYCVGQPSIIKGQEIIAVDSPAFMGVEIKSGDDLNDYKSFGKFQCPATAVTASLANTPTGVNGGFTLIVETSSATYLKQILVDNAMNIFIRRLSSGGNWGSWYLITMTQV